MKDISTKNAVNITDTVDQLNRKVFRDHPMQEPLQASKIVNEIFSNDLIKWISEL